MHLHFMVEDPSGEMLVEIIAKKLHDAQPSFTYKIKGYHGLGGFTRKNTVKETHTGKLLNDLATVLDGLNKKYSRIPDYPVAVVVVLDNDDRDTVHFRSELEAVAKSKNVSIDYVFCIAIEEMEAWLLGDKTAVKTAYPHAKMDIVDAYVQDSICGTWEVLANAVYHGGARELKKQNYHEIGKMKCEWAKTIGEHMNIDKNESPSFNSFITEFRKRINSVA